MIINIYKSGECTVEDYNDAIFFYEVYLTPTKDYKTVNALIRYLVIVPSTHSGVYHYINQAYNIRLIEIGFCWLSKKWRFRMDQLLVY